MPFDQEITRRPERRPDPARQEPRPAPMKLLHVIGSVNPAHGGPIEGMLKQAEATRAECECEIVCLDQPEDPWVEAVPFTVHALGVSAGYPLPLRHWRYSPLLAPWLRRNAREYDAVIVNGLWNYSAFGASRVLPGGPVPYYVFTHGMMDPWFRRTYPLKHAAKQLFWTVGEGRLMAGARSVLFTTEEERLLARGQFLDHRYRETVVGYGTATPPAPGPEQTEAFKAAAPKLGHRPYLLYLSRIHEKKGCDLLIEAFARSRALSGAGEADLQLVMAGHGSESLIQSLRNLAERLGVSDSIHWTGMILGDAKWGAFYNAEAFILPSHQENFGVVVAEALACGTPVLISDKVNIWREVAAAGAGLVQPDTVEGATALIHDWLKLPAEARRAMIGNGKALFQRSFDINSVGPALIEMIRRTAKPSPEDGAR
jgi:glycosyltransferase involved in cell wall biosynthesis